LSIIIPAYNEEKLLPACLTAIEKARAASGRSEAIEVIVTDNASTDKTAEIARANGARVVFETEHKISKVRNVGAKAASGRCLLFVDADTAISETAISEVLTAMSNPAAVGGGAYIRYDIGGLVAIVSWGLNHFLVSWGNAWGSFVFCERAAFARIGGFDESLYGTEEITFCRAMRAEARKQHQRVITIRRYLALTSGRRINRQLREILRRSFIFFNLKKNMQDPEVCRSVWYSEDR
jgi:glycosyltransferase involved in cell wall biosynthesis